jgi:two-component system sensor histidine kinase YesM
MRERGVLKKLRFIIVDRLKLGSIQSIIALSLTAVTILCMIIAGVALYGSFSQNAEKNAASSTQQIMDQVTINLEYYLRGMMEISDLMRSNLVNTAESTIIKLNDILNVTLKIRKDIVTMAVFDENGKIMLSDPEYLHDRNFKASDQDWFKNSLKDPSNYIIQPPHVQRMFESKRPWVVSLCRGVTVYNGDRLVNWVTMVDMNFSVIEELCNKVSLGRRGYIYVIDRYGNIIYHPQQQIVYAGLKQENIDEALKHEPGSYFDYFQGEKRIMTVKNISYTGWKMVGVSFVDELAENTQDFNNFIFYILLFVIAFGIAAATFISYKISQPIKRLEHQMNRIENGDFDIDLLEVKGEDEVKRLTKAFNLMITRIRQLMAQIIGEQEAKRKSEFKALQAQINPHFLYNTLDSIIWMNESRNYRGVTEMVAALAKFFRISISKGNEIIDVGDEIEHARSYLVIQKIRYKNKFDFSIEAAPEALQHKTLKLILQPIIENAIYHGIGNIQEKGEIKISVYIEGEAIVFRVADNGYGIKPERLKGILNREPSADQASGVGLKNVNERVKLCYGSQYGITIESEEEVGTAVFIRIPLSGLEEGNR